MLEEYANNTASREPLREIIAKQVAEYLAEGGRVEIIPASSPDEYAPTVLQVRLSDVEL